MASAVLRSPRVQSVNREHWLQNCGELIRPHIEEIASRTVPDFLISVSLPTRRGLSRKKRIIGQCIPLSNQGKKSHVFIHPMLVSIQDVAGTVAHELVHTLELGHGRSFGAIARPLGLEGKLTETTAGEAFFNLTDKQGRTLQRRLEALGPYPHEALDISRRAPAPTLLLKAQCKCGFIFRVTQKWVDDPGLPKCMCGGRFKLVESKRRTR